MTQTVKRILEEFHKKPTSTLSSIGDRVFHADEAEAQLKDLLIGKMTEEMIVKIIGSFAYPSVFGLPAIGATQFIGLSQALHQAIEKIVKEA